MTTGKELLELNQTGFVDIVTGSGGLALGVPAGHIRVLAEVERGGFVRRNGGDQSDIGDGQMLAGRVRLSLEEGVEEGEGVLNLLEVVRVGWLLGEDLGVVVVGESLVDGADIEVEALVDDGTLLGVLRVQRIGLAVLLHQIDDDGVRLPQNESVVIDRGHGVLGIELLKILSYYFQCLRHYV